MSEQPLVYNDRSDPDGIMGTKWEVGAQVEDEFEIVDEADAPEPPKKEEKPKAEAKPKAESDDDEPTEEELAEYSDKVQRRISKLTKKRREEERLRQAAERRAQEYEQRVQDLDRRYQESQSLIQRGQVALLAKIQAAAELSAKEAERKYREAFERGDSDGVIEAQRELYQAQNELNQANQFKQQAEQGRQVGYQPQPQQEPQQANVPQPDPRAQQWAEKNPWFGTDAEMTAYAYGAHEKMVRQEGYDPTSDEYYAEIEARIRRRFPEAFDEGEEVTETITTPPEVDEVNQPRKAQNVVAPGGRNNGSAPHKVVLTPSMRQTAKSLGLTEEQYAKELLKMQRTQR